jgi:hypothetical protein
MSSRKLRRALERMLDASPDEWAAILSRNPELLTPAVDEPLAYLIDVARRDGDEFRLSEARHLEELLREGRRIGLAAALAALAGHDGGEADAGYDFWEQYRSTGDPSMLDAAIEHWQTDLDECPPGTPNFAVAANNVATGFAARYERTREPEDLRRAVDAGEQALRATAPDAPERATRVSNWAALELQLFAVTNDVAHLDAAVDGLRAAVDATPARSPERALCFTNYARALYERYRESRADADLDAMVDAAGEAVRLTPPGSVDYSERQTTLAAGLERRYLDRDDRAALDLALDAWDEALANGAPDAPVALELMFAGGRGNWRRHRLTADPDDRFAGAERLGSAYIWGLDEARPLLEDLLGAEDGAEVPPPLLTFVDRLDHELGTYRQTGDPVFLDVAVRGWPVALAHAALSPQHPDRRAAALHQAAQAQWLRFEERGDDADMNSAIELFEECVALTAQGSPNLAPRRANLGMALSTRASLSADGADLPRAQELLEQALDADVPPDARAAFARTLTGVLAQSSARGLVADAAAVASRAIELLDGVLADLDADSPERSATLAARAAARLELYDRTLDPSTLEQAVAELEDLEAAPGAAGELPRLIALARALVDRHTLHGRLEDLDRGITLIEQVVDASGGSRLEGVALEELGLARLRRGVDLNRLSDVERALDALRAALDAAAPDSLQHWERLGCLGVATVTHAAATGDAEELARGVELMREAAPHLPESSPRRPLVLRALADAGAPEGDAAARVPGNPATALSDGLARLRRHAVTGAREDLDEALTALESAAALELSPQYRALALSTLGRAFVRRYRRDGDAADRTRAVDSFQTACAVARELDPMLAFEAAQSWAELEAEDVDWAAAAEPYRLGLDALSRLLATHALRAEKEVWLRDARGFAADAALGLSFARERRDAIVALEQSRALLLTEALQREQFDLERLRAKGRAELADAYERAAGRVAELERAELAGVAAPRPARSSLADEMEDARAALDAAVAEIRGVRGYGEAFASATFEDIALLAGDETVVYLCPGPTWGAAFVVKGGDAPPPMLLPSLASDRVATGVGYYLSAYAARAEQPDFWRGQLDMTLSWLWDVALGPLFEAGVFSGLYLGGDTPRPVVLVPVGLLALLPLHAAWTADASAPGGRRYLLDEVCVRYAPNVRVFAEARRRTDRGVAPRLLAVEEPRPVTAGPLHGAAAEVAAAAAAVLGARVLRHEEATVDAVLAELRTHTVAHFACHGRADPDDPLASFLLLAGDERLTLRTLMEQRLAQLELVVLSACETAIVGHDLPDEVVGLPAGLLRAGAGGVIASGWSVPDVSTAVLLTRFYELWREPSDPADALRRAQQWMRDSSNGEKLEHLPDLLGPAADRVPNTARRLWERAHGHRHPYFWAGFSYMGG